MSTSRSPPSRFGTHDSVVESEISQQKAQAHCLQQRGVGGMSKGKRGSRMLDLDLGVGVGVGAGVGVDGCRAGEYKIKKRTEA